MQPSLSADDTISRWQASFLKAGEHIVWREKPVAAAYVRGSMKNEFRAEFRARCTFLIVYPLVWVATKLMLHPDLIDKPASLVTDPGAIMLGLFIVYIGTCIGSLFANAQNTTYLITNKRVLIATVKSPSFQQKRQYAAKGQRVGKIISLCSWRKDQILAQKERCRADGSGDIIFTGDNIALQRAGKSRSLIGLKDVKQVKHFVDTLEKSDASEFDESKA